MINEAILDNIAQTVTHHIINNHKGEASDAVDMMEDILNDLGIGGTIDGLRYQAKYLVRDALEYWIDRDSHYTMKLELECLLKGW